ncbi:MAG: hypothetical protein KBE65_21465 [Phycisphaerae bacterium]|nr:hypothetical protein [Phycisphaerae bacterium]
MTPQHFSNAFEVFEYSVDRYCDIPTIDKQLVQRWKIELCQQIGAWGLARLLTNDAPSAAPKEDRPPTQKDGRISIGDLVPDSGGKELAHDKKPEEGKKAESDLQALSDEFDRQFAQGGQATS